MWNLLQTSLAAIVGAYIYIKPPLHPSESPHYSHAFEGVIKKPVVPVVGSCPAPVFAARQISLTNIRSDISKWLRHTQVQPLPVPFPCPPVTSCLRGRQAWLAESCWKVSVAPPQTRESDRFPRPSFWKTFQFSESLKASSLLSSFPSSFRSKVHRVLFICQAFQLAAAPPQHLSEGQPFSGSSICLELGRGLPHMDGLNAFYSSSVLLKWKQVFLFAKHSAELEFFLNDELKCALSWQEKVQTAKSKLARHHRTWFFGRRAHTHTSRLISLVHSVFFSTCSRIANTPPSFCSSDLCPILNALCYLVGVAVCSVSMVMHCRTLLLPEGPAHHGTECFTLTTHVVF